MSNAFDVRLLVGVSGIVAEPPKNAPPTLPILPSGLMGVAGDPNPPGRNSPRGDGSGGGGGGGGDAWLTGGGSGGAAGMMPEVDRGRPGKATPPAAFTVAPVRGNGGGMGMDRDLQSGGGGDGDGGGVAVDKAANKAAADEAATPSFSIL